MNIQLPDDNQIIRGLLDIQESISGECECGDEPDYHEASCPTLTPVRLRVANDDWEILHGDPGYDQDHRGFWSASTLGQDDDENALEQIAKQLLSEITEEIEESLSTNWA